MKNTIYRRHEADCKHRHQGARYWKCNCPVWIDGQDEAGKRRRHSLKTRSWSHGQDRLNAIEHGVIVPALAKPADTSPTVAVAIDQYLAGREAKRLAPSTILRYRQTLAPLGEHFGPQRVAQLTLDKLTKFRLTREVVRSTAKRKMNSTKLRATSTVSAEITRLRMFLKFCVKRKWIAENPAADLEKPKGRKTFVTLPFDAQGGTQEVDALLKASGEITENIGREVRFTKIGARQRIRTLILTLLYSGLRIGDAINLRRDAVDFKTGMVFLRTAKSGTDVYLKLKPIALEALRTLPVESPEYFFRNPAQKLSSAINCYRELLNRTARVAKVADVHPHRFRDWFAVTMLNNGALMQDVSLLLGHSSIAITEKYYAPFVLATQKRLNSTVENCLPDHVGLGAPPPQHPVENARRNAQGNVLPFSRAKAG